MEMLPASPYPNHNHLFRRRSCLKIFIHLSPILFGWSWIDTWYYGARWKHGCHPDDLWSSYFTSSDHVAIQRWLYGEPDVIEVRRTFKTEKETRKWESKVLKRMKVVKSQQWLNKTDRQGPYNASLSESHRKRISECNKGKKVSEETKHRISKNHAPCSGSANGFFGHIHTEESKERIGNRDYSNQKGGNHYDAKPVRINGEIYQSIKEASMKLKTHHSTISSYLKGRRNPPKGWVVEYLPKT